MVCKIKQVYRILKHVKIYFTAVCQSDFSFTHSRLDWKKNIAIAIAILLKTICIGLIGFIKKLITQQTAKIAIITKNNIPGNSLFIL